MIDLDHGAHHITSIMLSRLRGQWAEARAKSFLTQRGIILIDQNVRLKGSELDLIGREGEFIIFFEIKYRSSHTFGNALESLHPGQMNRIRQGAERYLMEHPEYQALACRFDVLALMPHRPIEWVIGAF
jgi:putative endonuclease